MAEVSTDVVIAGMGPTGLVLANLLGQYGIRVEIIEQRADLIDYPRGVGLDDESYRTMQTIGVLEEIKPYTLPHHVMRVVNGEGEVIMTNDPQGMPFGHPRKHGFIQPLVDRVLYENLAKFEQVNASFGRQLCGITALSDGVKVEVAHVSGEAGEHAEEGTTTYHAKFLVGCEGGRSFTRKWLGVDFEGVSPSTRWVVIDVRNDPLGVPNVYLGADPKRPYVSIGLPHGIRRFEFLLFDDEPNEKVEDDVFVTQLLADHLPEGVTLDIIRRRVFTHHGRVASSFNKGNVIIAGDAAHLMPVWMGQGFNSGVRDATNLAWKIAGVVKGDYAPGILDTYTAERREHAKAMVDLSLTLGNIIKPTNKLVAGSRDVLSKLINLSPQVRSYFSDMRFKPMPRYTSGVVVDQQSLESGRARPKLGGSKAVGPIALRNALNKNSAVGVQFIQPTVLVNAKQELLDDVLGNNFSVITWGMDPQSLFGKQATTVERLHWRQVCVVSAGQQQWALENCAKNTVVAVDHTGALKRWFDEHASGTVIVRPDRFVAAAVLNGSVERAVSAVCEAAYII